MGKLLFIPYRPINAHAVVHYHEARAVLEHNALFLKEIGIGDHLLELDDSSNTRAVNRLVAKTPGLKGDSIILRRKDPAAVLAKQLNAKKARPSIDEVAVVCYRCTPQDDHSTCPEDVKAVFGKILRSPRLTQWTLRLLGSHEVVLPHAQAFYELFSQWSDRYLHGNQYRTRRGRGTSVARKGYRCREMAGDNPISGICLFKAPASF